MAGLAETPMDSVVTTGVGAFSEENRETAGDALIEGTAPKTVSSDIVAEARRVRQETDVSVTVSATGRARKEIIFFIQMSARNPKLLAEGGIADGFHLSFNLGYLCTNGDIFNFSRLYVKIITYSLHPCNHLSQLLLQREILLCHSERSEESCEAKNLDLRNL